MQRNLIFILVALTALVVFYIAPPFYTAVIFPLRGFVSFLSAIPVIIPVIAAGLVSLLLLRFFKILTGGYMTGLIFALIVFLIICDIIAPAFTTGIRGIFR